MCRIVNVVCCVALFLDMGVAALPFWGRPTDDNSTLPSPEEFGTNFESDIKLTPEQMMSPMNGILNPYYRWENKIVPYKIDDSFTPTQQAVIISAMTEIASKTCIQFKPRDAEANYVDFRNANTGCWSYVGCVRGAQVLNLYANGGCVTRGVAMHEILHALGFFHTQSDVDRDQYVKINYDNMISGKEHNFQSYTNSYITNFGEGYDYESILHYSAYAFTKNGKKTIEPTQPGVTIGQRSYLSVKDISKILKMYECVAVGG